MASSSPTTMTDEIVPGPRMVTKNDLLDEDGKPITKLPYFLNPFSVHVVKPPYQSRSLHSWDFPLLTGLRKQYGAIGDGTSSIGGRVIPLGEVDDHSSDHIIVTHSYDVNDRKKYQLFAVSGIFIASFMLVITIMMSARTAFPAEQSLLRTIIFKQVLHPEPPTKYWGSVTKPYPTGAFWTNLVVRTGDGAIGVYPYGVKTTDTGVQVNDNTLPHTLSIHTNYNASTLSILSNTHTLPNTGELRIFATHCDDYRHHRPVLCGSTDRRDTGVHLESCGIVRQCFRHCWLQNNTQRKVSNPFGQRYAFLNYSIPT